MLRKFGIIAVLAMLVTALTAAPVLAANPHTVPSGAPVTCTLNPAGDTVTCAGELAGLGNVNFITVTVEAAGGCATPNEQANEPPGHVQSTSEPIRVSKNGRATFSQPLTVDCPPGLDPVFGSTADIFIFNAETGALITSFENIPITQL